MWNIGRRFGGRSPDIGRPRVIQKTQEVVDGFNLGLKVHVEDSTVAGAAFLLICDPDQRKCIEILRELVSKTEGKVSPPCSWDYSVSRTAEGSRSFLCHAWLDLAPF
jgi:hypothetical protein